MPVLAVLGLGMGLGIVDNFGAAGLLDPAAAVAAAPLEVLVPAALWACQCVATWLFGGVVVGVLFWPQPGLDDRPPREATPDR